jgi:hypothetical protein
VTDGIGTRLPDRRHRRGRSRGRVRLLPGPRRTVVIVVVGSVGQVYRRNYTRTSRN